jgi:hypothetical protein
MTTSTAARLFWSYQAPLAGALVVHKAFSIQNEDVTTCEKGPNTRLQSRVSFFGVSYKP